MIDYKKQGKRNKINGANFERKVREDLESDGWIVIKNPNNLINDKFTQGKSKYNPFTKTLMMNSGGFPDFIIYKISYISPNKNNRYEIQFIECKINGKLDKIEKEKARWYLDNNFCSKFLIASKKKVGRKVEVEYKEFNDILSK